MSYRRNGAKLDWTCKRCKDARGEPYRNISTRTARNRCNICKGSCCVGVVKPSLPSQSTRIKQPASLETKAQQQVREASAAAKAAKKEAQKLRKQNAVLQKKLDAGGEVEGDDAMDCGGGPAALTTEQLQARVDFFISQQYLQRTLLKGTKRMGNMDRRNV